MSQRIKLKFFTSNEAMADLVVELSEQGFNIEMAPTQDGEYYVLVAELNYEGEEPTALAEGRRIILYSTTNKNPA